MNDLNRRDFLAALAMGASALALDPASTQAAPAPGPIKPISGTWFEFQHHATVEAVDWNPACVRFSANQWEAKIKEIAETGMEYVALMATALYYRAFYDTSIFAKWNLDCANPLETVLSAADKYGIKLFMGGGFYGHWEGTSTIQDPAATKKRLQAIEELANLYGHHACFYGWYWPVEANINPYYSPEYIRYVNDCSRLARQLTPKAQIMIGPYGTRVARPDDEYVRQLDALDVDIVAYQDEVGVQKSKVTETAAFYAGLCKAHDRAQKAKIWADIEIFEFQGKVYDSALMPAPFSRVLSQMEAVSPWVDKILVYQYQGMMNKPGSEAFAGCPTSTKLYSDYRDWRETQSASA